jgi:ketosteroid isomerase-like protein
MHPNAALIRRFYAAFARRDGDEMSSLYHPAAEFSDPVFIDLRGDRAGAMLRMLAARARDLAIVVSDVHGDDRTGGAHWEARYTYSATGRSEHNLHGAEGAESRSRERSEPRYKTRPEAENIIEAEFEDGRIRRHTDRFDLWRWAGMALGLPGRLLG